MVIATIGKIVEMLPIEKADTLNIAIVVCGKLGKWQGVVRKEEFGVGQLCEVYLPDALVPHEERFAFMEKRHWRVSQARFRGVPSECLIMRRSEVIQDMEIGSDIASLVGAEKYDKPVPAHFGDAYGSFPSFIPKTDELHMQASEHLVEALIGKPYYITEKIDGTSGTCFRYEDHVGCCSRNWELKESETSMVWMVANRYGIPGALKELYNNMAVQFEVYGPGIQSNPIGVNRIGLAIFNLYNIDEHRYMGFDELQYFCNKFNIPMVKILAQGDAFHLTYNDLQSICMKGNYRPSNHPREGIVVRSKIETDVNGDRLSFKLINLKYEK